MNKTFTQLENAGFLDLKHRLHILLLRLLLLPPNLSVRAFSVAFFAPSSNMDSWSTS
jgi:hypothetical protein